MEAKKVLILTGDFTEDWEVMTFIQICKFMNMHVDVCSPEKKQGDKIQTVCWEADRSEKPGHLVTCTCDFEQCQKDLSSYTGLCIPGARSPETLRLDPRVLDCCKHFMNNKKPVCTVCHGPMILAAAGLLKGVKCTASLPLTPDLPAWGAVYQDISKDHSACVTDDEHGLVSTMGATGLPRAMQEFCRLCNVHQQMQARA